MDDSTAGQIQQELLSVIDHRPATLIADMTATIWCDHAGAGAVARAFQWAVLSGTELRLVVITPAVSRVLSLSGVDRLVPIYISLAAATAPSAPAAVLALAARPGRTPTSGRAPPHRGGPLASQADSLRHRPALASRQQFDPVAASTPPRRAGGRRPQQHPDRPGTAAGRMKAADLAAATATQLRCGGCHAQALYAQDEPCYGQLVRAFLGQHELCGNAVRITCVRGGGRN
jgi:anti-anti-sigma factor